MIYHGAIDCLEGVMSGVLLFAGFSLEPVAFGVMSGMAGEFALMVRGNDNPRCRKILTILPCVSV